MFVYVLSPECSSGDTFQSLVLYGAYKSSLEFIHSLVQVHGSVEHFTALSGASEGWWKVMHISPPEAYVWRKLINCAFECLALDGH